MKVNVSGCFFSERSVVNRMSIVCDRFGHISTRLHTSPSESGTASIRRI